MPAAAVRCKCEHIAYPHAAAPVSGGLKRAGLVGAGLQSRGAMKRQQRASKKDRKAEKKAAKRRARNATGAAAAGAGTTAPNPTLSLESRLLKLLPPCPAAGPSPPSPCRRADLLGRGGDVFELPDFLSPRECAHVVACVEAEGFSRTEQRETRWAACRRNGRLAVDAPALAARLWQRCADAFSDEGRSTPVGLSPNFRFYKYEPGDRFGMHVDDSVDHGGGRRSTFTLLVYLNDAGDGLTGGATVFYKGSSVGKAKEVLRFAPKRGSALAHIHGPRCMLHEGAAVESGVKYLMRTDVLFGPKG